VGVSWLGGRDSNPDTVVQRSVWDSGPLRSATVCSGFLDHLYGLLRSVSVGSRAIRLFVSHLGRAWELRDKLTAYDAMYVALAEALDARVVTCDAPLAATPGHRVRIEVIR